MLFWFRSLDVTKFFGCELGAQVQMNAKEDRYIVNGSHDCEKLQNLLDGFIKRFVLCPNCDNPETKLVSLVFLDERRKNDSNNVEKRKLFDSIKYYCCWLINQII